MARGLRRSLGRDQSNEINNRSDWLAVRASAASLVVSCIKGPFSKLHRRLDSRPAYVGIKTDATCCTVSAKEADRPESYGRHHFPSPLCSLIKPISTTKVSPSKFPQHRRIKTSPGQGPDLSRSKFVLLGRRARVQRSSLICISVGNGKQAENLGGCLLRLNDTGWIPAFAGRTEPVSTACSTRPKVDFQTAS